MGRLTRLNVRAGSHSIAFSGRIGAKPLRPHSYQAVLIASASGKRSLPVFLSFTIVR